VAATLERAAFRKARRRKARRTLLSRGVRGRPLVSVIPAARR
jgi:hypothetical protein